MKPGTALILLGMLALGLGAGWWLWLSPADGDAAAGPDAAVAYGPRTGPMPGERAPDFRLPALDGGTVALSEHRGHRVLLDFFASWCEPCRLEMPGVQRQAEVHAEHEWTVIAVSVMESREAASAFRDEFGLAFPVLLDERGIVTRQYLVTGTPTNLTIDRDGIVVERSLGYMSEAEIEAMIARVP